MQIEFPGFFDLQVNGFAGVDFNDSAMTADDMQRAITAMRATGVTRFLPTLITSSREHFAKCAKAVMQTKHPEIAGIHMEGPYISPEDGARGCHPREQVVAASIDDFERRQEATAGMIKLVTIAPETGGAVRFIEYLVARDVRVAIGHTMASPEQISDAVKAGASMSTHLGNGSPQLLLRHPNFIWEQLGSDDLLASLIVDGHHLPPATVKSMVRAKTPARILLVTDAVAAAGCKPGTYELSGEQVVLSENGRVSKPGKPGLAGSAITLDKAVGLTVKFTGLPIEEVLPMASTRPAEYMGAKAAGRVTADWNAAECRLTILKVLDA